MTAKRGFLFMKKWFVFLCLICMLCSLVPAVGAAENPAGEKFLLGDVNKDGAISAADARIALRVSVGLDAAGDVADRMDVDGDKKITASDARYILRRAVNLDPWFPVEAPYPAPDESIQLDADVDAPRALLYCKETNQILYQRNIDDSAAPASLMKLLTTLTALKYCSPDQVFTVGDEIELIGWDSSVCPLVEGWKLTLRQLIYGMMLPSGNDAAYCVAANVAKTLQPELSSEEAVEYFVQLMNRMGWELGLKDTVAKSPDGYDEEGQYTTARDLLTVTRAAIENDLIVEICSTPTLTFSPTYGVTVTWSTTNRFLREDDYFEDDRVFGMKGGFTDDAGCCLIAGFKENGRTYITIVMGLDSFNDRYLESWALMNAL